MLFYFGTAQESGEKAAHEICVLESQRLDDTASTTDIDSVLDTKVSDDGAWQKRGHSFTQPCSDIDWKWKMYRL